MNWGRRGFFQLAGALLLASRAKRLFAQDNDLHIFATALLFSLVPNRDVPHSLYEDEARRLLASASGRGLLISSRDALRDLTGHDWMLLDSESRITTLVRLSSVPAVMQLRRAIAGSVYSHPDSFAATGYGGSSLEFGGYLQRGFNDIDWLPDISP